MVGVAVVLFASASCAGGVDSSSGTGSPSPEEQPLAPSGMRPPLLGTSVASAFVELAPTEVRLGAASEPVVQVPGVRMFYRLAPASAEAGEARLCVVFNGGPGVASASLWLQLGPATQNRLTRLCHALFIDSRAAGLSYQLVQSPEDYEPSFVEFNAYVDALDHLRLLAALVPVLPGQLDEVVFVAESYGGVRATLMLDTLLAPDRQRPFEWQDLRGELAPLFERWGPELTEVNLAQALIQPTLAGDLQDAEVGRLLKEEGSPLRRLAQSLSHELAPCGATCDGFPWMLDELERMGRSPYDSRASSDWLSRQLRATQTYVAEDLLQELQVAGLPPGLPPNQRVDAFKAQPSAGLPADPTSWTEGLGTLPEVDRYFVAFNTEVYSAFTSESARDRRIDAFEYSFAELFLQNLHRVSTLVTRAEFDLLNYWPAVPLALETSPVVANISVDDEAGIWTVRYTDGEARTVQAPHYIASHSVALDQPQQLLVDLQDWLEGGRAGTEDAP